MMKTAADSSIGHDFSTSESNRELNFRVIQRAAELLQDKLRIDEVASGDLYDRLACKRCSSFDRQSHAKEGQDYYLDPYMSPYWGPMIQHSKFVEMPKKIIDQGKKLECASFMGIIPEINRIWVTVDNKLFLWNYLRTDEIDFEECETFDGMKEVIISVSLASPRPEIFLDRVQYILVVASPLEVVLLAISYATQDSDQCNKLKLISTSVSLPSDGISMFKIVGSQSGRIFMAGNDGNMYELEYSHQEQYWASLLGVDGDDSATMAKRVKCQKVNHFKWNWHLIHFIPPVLRSVTGFRDEGLLADVVIDDMRQMLYTLSSTSVLSVFYLGSDGMQNVFVVKSFNILSEASTFLSNNRMGVSSHSLRSTESFINGIADANTNASFNIIGLFPIPIIESVKLHVVAVLANGTRIYLSLLCADRILYGVSGLSNECGPASIEISCVRFPPPFEALKHVLQQTNAAAPHSIVTAASRSHEGLDLDANNGFPATCHRGIKASSCLYSRGVFMLGVDRFEAPATAVGSGGELDSDVDQLLTVFEEPIAHRPYNVMMQDTNLSPSLYREGIASDVSQYSSSASSPSLRSGLDTSCVSLSGKIFDIKESTNAIIHSKPIAQMTTLFAVSHTPTSNSVIRDASHHEKKCSDSKSSASRRLLVPVVNAVALGRSHKNDSTAAWGCNQASLKLLTLLSESCYMHAPFGANVPTQRQFVVLTNSGAHILTKTRACDIIFKKLMRVDSTESLQSLGAYYSESFGKLALCCICLGLALGLPGDAGGSSNLIPLPAVQIRAMSVIRDHSDGAHFKVVGGALTNNHASMNSAIVDSRLVLNGSSHEFVSSTFHDAVYCVASRVLRPVWLRSVVSGGQVSEIWTAELISQVSAPLLELMKLLQGYYPTVIMTAHSPAGGLQSDEMDSRLVTSQMLAASQANRVMNPEKVLHQKAKHLEDESISNIYRLASRSVQALSLIGLLTSLQTQWKVQIEWTALPDLLSFRSLIVSASVHDIVKKMLNALIHNACKSEKHGVAAAMNNAINVMTEQCYHYFSAGDWYTYMAARKIETLRSKTNLVASGGSYFHATAFNVRDSIGKEVEQLATECVEFVIQSAKHWNIAEHVVGVHSELFKACAELMSFRFEVMFLGVVDLCLAAASSFLQLSRKRFDGGLAGSRASGGMVPYSPHALASASTADKWDLGLYHGGSAMNDCDVKRAVDACYTCLAEQIVHVRSLNIGGHEEVKGSAGDLMDSDHSYSSENNTRIMSDMIQRALSSCSEQAMHIALYTILLDRNELELLLAIRSAHLEKFLLERSTSLLYSYYEQHSEYIKASNLMSIMARSDEDTDIETRVDYLNKAISSAQRAIAFLQTNRTPVSRYAGNNNSLIVQYSKPDASDKLLSSTQLVVENMNELKDLLDIIVYQRMAESYLTSDYNDLCQRFQQSVDSTGNSLLNTADVRVKENLDIMERNVHRLRFKLLGITELYHDICGPYKLWDVSLLLLNASKTGDHDLVAKLWRSLIYRYVPIRSSSGEGQQFLRSKRSRDRSVNAIEVYERYNSTAACFEEASLWLPAMLKAVATLGEALLGSVSFPGIIVLDELEDIVTTLRACQVSLNRGLLTDCFLDMGMSFGGLLELYIDLFDLWSAKKSPDKQLQILSSASILLLQWTDITMQRSSIGDSATFGRELMVAIRSGRMRGWIEKLRKYISSLSSKFSSINDASHRKLLEDTSSEFYRINERIIELTVV